jgi:CubicO group peptidase (beta-lactamase class C family)
MAPAHDTLDLPAAPSPRLSRRQYLSLTAAGLATSILQACGGGGDSAAFAATANGASVAVWGRDAVASAMAKSDTGAVSVALWSGGQVVWQEAFGWADSEAKIRAGTQTRFNIGSVSKVLAALSAMILQDRGLLTLDTPVVRYLPEFSMLSDGYRRITVRHLLSHSSGLPGTHTRNVFSFAPHTDYAANAESALADTHLKHEPGELAVYCNDGFTMIERVVLALTGQSYPAFVRTAILEPLGMDQSSFTLAPFAEGSFAHPHDGKQWPQEFVSAFATGGLSSTPGDMLRLGRMLLGAGMFEGRRIVSAAGVAEMGRNQTSALLINPSPDLQIGLGWDNVRQSGMRAVGQTAWQKNGGTAFFTSEFYVLPEADMVLMLTGNSLGYGASVLAESIMLRALQDRRTIATLPPPVSHVPPDPAAAPGPDPALAGIYGNFRGAIQAAFVGGRLSLRRWSADGWTSMYAGLALRSDGRWWSESGDGYAFEFVVIRGLRYVVQRRPGGSGHYWDAAPLGQQLQPLEGALSPAWQARIGSTWELANEAPDSAAVRRGPVRASLALLPELPGYLMWADGELLRPLDDTRAGMTVKVPVNDGRDLTELVFRTVGGVEQLQSNGSIFRRVEPGT